MAGFIDLHCHFVANIDDGAPSVDEGIRMLEGLKGLGFELVFATPHMRPGLFDNSATDLRTAFDRMVPHLKRHPSLPNVRLSSEHYFDDVVFARILNGEALPYPGGKAVLLEFYEIDFPPTIFQRLSDIRRQKRLLPVIAHPERYRCLWGKPDVLQRLVDAGFAALLDTAAVVGKYGRRPKRCAEELLERGLYHAACSDSHRAKDMDHVQAGMRRIEKLYGADEIDFLFRQGPQSLLSGTLPE